MPERMFAKLFALWLTHLIASFISLVGVLTRHISQPEHLAAPDHTKRQSNNLIFIHRVTNCLFVSIVFIQHSVKLHTCNWLMYSISTSPFHYCAVKSATLETRTGPRFK